MERRGKGPPPSPVSVAGPAVSRRRPRCRLALPALWPALLLLVFAVLSMAPAVGFVFPAIETVEPAVGASAGGTVITMGGEFEPLTAALLRLHVACVFGSRGLVPASVNTTSLQCRAPAHPPGFVQVGGVPSAIFYVLFAALPFCDAVPQYPLLCFNRGHSVRRACAARWTSPYIT